MAPNCGHYTGMQTGVAGGVGGGTQIIKLIGERKYFDSFQNDTNKPANCATVGLRKILLGAI